MTSAAPQVCVRLGQLVWELQNAVQSQGFVWDEAWIVDLLERTGLMHLEGPHCTLSPFASECVDAFLAKEPVE
jgi:hypothetical protein